MLEVFDDKPVKQEPEADQQGEAQVETEAPEQAEVEAEAAATPAADTEKHVPLAALEAVRGERKDWKEKALRYEGELKAMRENANRQAPEPAEEMDPAVAFAMRQETIILNASERMARKSYGEEEVDKAFALIEKNPHLRAAALQQADPWDFVVREGRKLAALAEIGDDPVAYRNRLEAEITAKLTAQPAARPTLPQSLAGSRSTAARTAPGFTGPPELKDIFG